MYKIQAWNCYEDNLHTIVNLDIIAIFKKQMVSWF